MFLFNQCTYLKYQVNLRTSFIICSTQLICSHVRPKGVVRLVCPTLRMYSLEGFYNLWQFFCLWVDAPITTSWTHISEDYSKDTQDWRNIVAISSLRMHALAILLLWWNEHMITCQFRATIKRATLLKSVSWQFNPLNIPIQ